MTFSDSRIVKLLQDEFIPVWESVSPVREVTFDLGEGRSVSGTVGGEIAIYFCTPEGFVFDILPALQSPVATKRAMEEALAFYKKTKDALEQMEKNNNSSHSDIELATIPSANVHPHFKAQSFAPFVLAWHSHRMREQFIELYNDNPEKYQQRLDPVIERQKNEDNSVRDSQFAQFTGANGKTIDLGNPEKIKAEELYPQAKTGEEKRDQYISAAMDEATRHMRVMAVSKVAMPSQPEPITVVEPGGRGYFMWQVHRAFLGVLPNPDEARLGMTGSSLMKPSGWQEPLFVHILKQPLEGGKVTYDSESLEAISIIEK